MKNVNELPGFRLLLAEKTVFTVVVVVVFFVVIVAVNVFVSEKIGG